MPADASIPPLLLDAAGVCARLCIGLSHLHAMRRQGRFPLQPIRLGRAVRFRSDDLSAWCAAGCPPAGRWSAMQQVSEGPAIQVHVQNGNVFIANGPQRTDIGKIVLSNRNFRETELWLSKLILGAIFQLIVGILQALFIWYLNGR